MKPLDWLRTSHVTVSESQAELLQHCQQAMYPVQVKPSRNQSLPATPSEFIRGIMEIQTKWLKLRNASPTLAFEIRRSTPDSLKLQYVAPTKRLERKLRTQLTDTIPGIELTTGFNGVPVLPDDTVGGGLLSTGRMDWYPLQTEFDDPPTNAVVSTLHRHAMRDTKFVIQVLFRPVAGKPVRRRWWRRRAYQRIGYLRKEKENLWGSRSPTPREKQQADAVERKAASRRFHISIRLLIVNAAEYTRSRVKEVAGAYNRFENPDTGQYLNMNTATSIRANSILDFADAVANRRFAGWSLSFQATVDELAALVSIPDRVQSNIEYSQS